VLRSKGHEALERRVIHLRDGAHVSGYVLSWRRALAPNRARASC
jgi:hypothetical protein